MVEFILASPTTAQAVVALLALLFVLLANIYSRLKRQEWEKELLRLAADPRHQRRFVAQFSVGWGKGVDFEGRLVADRSGRGARRSLGALDILRVTNGDQ